MSPVTRNPSPDPAAPLRILTFSTLYPNAAQPSHGVFVENRIRHLAASGAAKIEVVAPVPVFPVVRHFMPAYAEAEKAPLQEVRHGLTVRHPRYLLMPKISMLAAPLSLYCSARPVVAQLKRDGFDFDLIDAHYFYPDGIAAVMLGRHFRRPVTITARGTDINLIPEHYWPGRMIQWAARESAGMITVCAALKDGLTALGADAAKIRVLRNGVDLQVFRPVDRNAARQRLGLTAPTLLSVGHLIPRKAHDLVIRAVAQLPGYHLLIAGLGPEEQRLRALARTSGVEDRVRFLGRVAHDQLREVYGAADLLVLASSREGWANVLLESMACGTRVAASDVWGTPEVVAAPEAGALFKERTPDAIAATVRKVMAQPEDRAATRRYAEGFSWDDTTRGQLELFRAIVAAERSSPSNALAAAGTSL
ncbi:MAG TPA: glycosyltransferase family 4 protein [Alphaproteobacteria bacterium]|nr:glycosyltransferase family 4 protein [Alphaproteobacteria bacterium]